MNKKKSEKPVKKNQGFLLKKFIQHNRMLFHGDTT